MNSKPWITNVFILVLVLAILAPCTFLKPKQTVESLKTQPESSKKHAIKPTVKKVIEKPLHQVDLPDFGAIRDVKSKKIKFFEFMRPSVERENAKLLAKRAVLESWLEKVSLGLSLSDEEFSQLKGLVKKYRVSKRASVLQQVNDLLVRVDIVPTSLVLVQSANESAWGTSRFSRIGLNFFGIWCYREGCGMVPSGRNSGAKHEVEAFQSVDAAVARYFFNINSHNAYRVFRTIRFELRSQNQPINPEILATGLLPYSERGADYVIEISKMLRQNKKFLTASPVNENLAVSE